MTEPVNIEKFAANVLLLLQQDPRRYRNFGAWWFLVKAALKRYYTRDNLHLLGDYVDRSVTDRLPAVPLDEALQQAIETYRHNAAYNLNRAQVEDPSGETFTLYDEDAGL